MAWLRRLVLNNWYLKLLSLGLAYAMWQGVADAPAVELRVVVPLEFRNLADGLELAGEIPHHVQVTLTGSEKRLRELAYEQLLTTIDLAQFEAGNHTYRFSSADVHVPPGVGVAGIQPATVRLELVPRAEP